MKVLNFVEGEERDEGTYFTYQVQITDGWFLAGSRTSLCEHIQEKRNNQPQGTDTCQLNSSALKQRLLCHFKNGNSNCQLD